MVFLSQIVIYENTQWFSFLILADIFPFDLDFHLLILITE